ncbi:MAG: ABC transporter ATP-binding protein [bacterium]|nr:ABC transporter ATP-binding protein [bacterium]
MIETIKLTKQYFKLTAVKDLDLNVQAGEIFGFLGPNGAGKTTTLRIIGGLIQPTRGTVRVFGHDVLKDPVAARQIIGFIPDRPFLYQKLTGEEFLRFIAQIWGLDDRKAKMEMDRLLEIFDLSEWRDELIESYSHGMKQKLVMVSALLHEPKAIVIDEPFVGLDPRATRLVKDIFQEYRRKGCAILLSTHTLSVAEEIADRIGIIHLGSMIAVGTPDNIKTRSGFQDERLEEVFLKITSPVHAG